MGSKIKDLCVHISSGGTPSRKKEEYYKDGQINWIKTKELNDCNIYDSEEKITEEGLKNSSAKIFPINTVVMAMYGATAGKLGIMKKESSTNQACCNMVVNETKCDYRFLFYSLLYSREKLINLASGAAQQNLNLSLIGNFDIDCPTLPEQQKIASILSAFDDKIELNNEMNKTLKEIAQIVFKHWFIDFEFPNENGEPYKSSGGEFEDSELGPIPKGWKVKNIGELIDYAIGGDWGKSRLINDYNTKAVCIRGADFPPILQGNIKEAPIRFIKTNSFSKRKLKHGDILIEISGGTKGRPTGRTVFIHENLVSFFEDSMVFSNFCRLIRTNNMLNSAILFLYLQHIYNNGNIRRYEVQSTGISNFQFKYFCEKEALAVPPLVLQKYFIKIIKPIFNKMYTFKNYYLSQLRDTLLPKLISGEIRVV